MGRRELLRVDARVEVEYKKFDQFYKEYTKNISKGGIFIGTENVFKPQTVLEIALRVPGMPQAITVVGEVVHSIDQELAKKGGWEPGMGIHFVDFNEESQRLLEEYVAKSLKEDASRISPDRRRHTRVAIRLRVKFPSLEVLKHDYSRDISRGGIFIQTSKPRQVGDQFALTLVHPVSGDELELTGEVVRIAHIDPTSPGSVPGMGIRFADMNEEKRRQVGKFLGQDAIKD